MSKLYAARINRNCRGFTLLEALIALLVLSIGLLGLAGLQSTGSRLSYEAYIRSITTLAASEIIEKIRSRTGKLDRASRPNVISQYAGANAGACAAGDASIDNDVSCWNQNITAQLPDGQGLITDHADGSFTISISWYDRDTEDTNTVSWTFVAGAL
jgi:type IV pilus assembly protein PilV